MTDVDVLESIEGAFDINPSVPEFVIETRSALIIGRVHYDFSQGIRRQERGQSENQCTQAADMRCCHGRTAKGRIILRISILVQIHCIIGKSGINVTSRSGDRNLGANAREYGGVVSIVG